MSAKRVLTSLPVCFAVALAIVFTLAITGCDNNDTRQTRVDKQQTIRITGSSTCLPLLKILTNEYNKKHPDIRFLYLPGAHSPAGIQGAAKGTLDVGAVSRDLKPEEEDLGLEYIKLSDDGLALATHMDLDVSSLTSQDIKNIYSGQVTNWLELGGPDSPIVVLDRAEDESSKVILREYVLGDTPVIQSAIVMFLETDIINALQTTPSCIGYCSLGAIISDKLPVNVLTLDGVKPSVSSIQNGTYKMVRPMGIVLKKNPDAATRAFADWVKSNEAAEILDSKGYASVK